MTTYIEILYSDLSQQKEAIEDIDKLLTDNVLFILITTDEEVGSYQNIASSSGFDNYVICTRRSASEDWVMLIGYDDDYFTWRKTRCTTCVSAKESVDIPLGNWHVIFRGVHVEEEIWTQAQEIIREMT